MGFNVNECKFLSEAGFFALTNSHTITSVGLSFDPFSQTQLEKIISVVTNVTWWTISDPRHRLDQLRLRELGESRQITIQVADENNSVRGITRASSVLSFYLLSPTNLPGGRYINTGNLPKLGYVLGRPDWVVRELRSISYGEMRNRVPGRDGDVARPSVTLEFQEADAEALTKLTREQLGKRIALFIDDVPVAAPKIGALDGGRRTVIDFANDAEFKLVKPYF